MWNHHDTFVVAESIEYILVKLLVGNDMCSFDTEFLYYLLRCFLTIGFFVNRYIHQFQADFIGKLPKRFKLCEVSAAGATPACPYIQ